MIVFKKDWYKYKRAIPDLKTKNKSFLHYANLLRNMGVSHWYFPLALHNPDIAGLSPYDEGLTEEQKTMMHRECDVNPWWYLRELAIDPKGGSDYDDFIFKANRGNIAAMWLLVACIDYIQIQPRQTGKSFGADTNTLWLKYFKYKDTDLNLITKDDKTRVSNINRLKLIRDGWPTFMCKNTKHDDNNQSTMSCKMLGNKLFTHVSQSSEKGANNLGRGLTSPYLQIDEAPFIEHIQTVLSAASGGTNTARAIAERKGVPYCTVITTTAGNIEDPDGAFVYDIWQEATVWSEHFFDAEDRDHLVTMILANGKARTPTINLTLSHRQLGFTDAWLYDSIARSRGEVSNIDKDYMNKWGSSSDNSILSKAISDVIKKSESDPSNMWISKENYMWKWYEDIKPDAKYILCVDTSNAIGRDDIANVLISSYNGAVVGAAAINDTNLHRYSEWLAEFLIKHKNVILVIENMLNAQVIIDYLLVVLPEHGENPFKRIFNKVVNDKETRPKDFTEIDFRGSDAHFTVYEKFRTDFGFKQNQDSRKFLYSIVLQNAASDSGDKVRDRQLVNQILSLKNKNGKIDHGSKGHDDMVVGWMLGHWFLNHASNLYYYGLHPKDVMVERSVKGNALTPRELFDNKIQDAYKESITSISDKLSETKDNLEVIKLEARLISLKDRVKETTLGSGKTIEQIIQDARDKRNTRYTGIGSGDRVYNSAKALLSFR